MRLSCFEGERFAVIIIKASVVPGGTHSWLHHRNPSVKTLGYCRMHKNAEGIEGSETSKKIANLPNPVTAERIINRGATETRAEIAQR